MSADSRQYAPAHTETVQVAPDDPRALRVLADLEREYDSRYHDLGHHSANTEINRYPLDRFLPPDGAFVLLLRGDEVVAAGAFMRFDENTAEFKRIWTHPGHRRQGLSRRLLAELEREATNRGYGRIFLTTGPRQPEAVQLYRTSGYTDAPWPIEPGSAEDDGIVGFAFEKTLPTGPAD